MLDHVYARSCEPVTFLVPPTVFRDTVPITKVKESHRTRDDGWQDGNLRSLIVQTQGTILVHNLNY